MIDCAAQPMHTAGFIPRTRTIRALSLCAAWILLLSAPVQAQDSALPPAVVPTLSDFTGEPTGYRELIAEALAEYQARHFEEARALFKRAHVLLPNARTMRGQGMAEFELRNYGSAVQSFEAALTSQVRPLDPVLREETEQLLERARRFVARVRLELKPGSASVVVDGVLMHVEPGAVLLLSIGNHSVEIRADAYRPTQRTLSVQGGEEQVLEVVLVPAEGAAPGAGSRPSSPRRFSVGPQLSGLAPVQGYARRTPGLGVDLSFWSVFSAWALDLRLGLRFDVAEENRDYFHVPFEVAGYRLLPFADHAGWFGLGTGLTYVHERVAFTQTTGEFAVTRVSTVFDDRTLGVPVFARVGMLFFRSSAASLLTSVDYGITFADLKEVSNEQAVRFHVGALFGRGR